MTIIIISTKAIGTKINEGLINKAAQITLDFNERPDFDITIKLTGDDEICQLNRAYRGLDEPTDVLAFNQEYIDPETGRFYLGDIIISVERARAQAPENDHSLNDECALLTIHGTLHLLGFDHADEQHKDEMWSIQDRILENLTSFLQEDSE